MPETTTKPGRLFNGWDDLADWKSIDWSDHPDWKIHELDSYVYLEPLSARAEAFAEENGLAREEECFWGDLTAPLGWIPAEMNDWDTESAVALEIARGWNVLAHYPLDLQSFGASLAALLEDVDRSPHPASRDMSEEAVRAALDLVTSTREVA